jgi:hypothetical protein
MNATNRQQIRAAEKEAKAAAAERLEVIRGLMMVRASRRWVFDRLAAAGVFTSIFSTNALTMAFNEGQRNQGLALLADIMAACPERFIEMLQEQQTREAAAERMRNGRPSNGADPDSADDDSDGGIDRDAPDADAFERFTADRFTD